MIGAGRQRPARACAWACVAWVMPVRAAASVPCSETSTKALWTTSEIARLRFGSMPEKWPAGETCGHAHG